MVWRNHGSGALPEDNCPDHLNKWKVTEGLFPPFNLYSDDDDGGEYSGDDSPNYDDINVDYSPVWHVPLATGPKECAGASLVPRVKASELIPILKI